jgi:hypothetical protein
VRETDVLVRDHALEEARGTRSVVLEGAGDGGAVLPAVTDTAVVNSTLEDVLRPA